LGLPGYTSGAGPSSEGSRFEKKRKRKKKKGWEILDSLDQGNGIFVQGDGFGIR
jgi:hypothetical protein